MRSLDEIREIVNNAYYYACTGNDFEASLMDDTLVKVSWEELALVDTRLPIYIKECSSVDAEFDKKLSIYGGYVDDTLQYWAGECAELVDTNYEVRIPFVIDDIDVEATEVIIYGQHRSVGVFYTHIDGVETSIDYVRPNGQGMFIVDRSRLREIYPDWESRWGAVRSMDIEANLIPDLIFKKPSPQQRVNVTLPSDLSIYE